MAKTFVIIEVLGVDDPDTIGTYAAGIQPSLAAAGGKLVGQGLEVFEGKTEARMFAIQEWPSAEAFKAWQASAAYQPFLAMRKRAARINIYIVPGV